MDNLKGKFSQLREKFEGLSQEEKEEVLELPAYLMDVGRYKTALQMVMHIDFMELKIRAEGVSVLVSDYDALSANCEALDACRCLKAVREVLVQSAHILQSSPHQVVEQLLARLAAAQREEFTVITNRRLEKACPYLRPMSNTLAKADGTEWKIQVSNMPLRACLCGRIAVVASSGSVEAWELTHHRKLWCVEAEHVGFAFALFQEQVVTGYGESQLAYLSIANGTVIRRHARPPGVVFAICVNPVNRLVILAYKDGRLALLDMETGDTEAIIDAHDEDINDVAVTRNGSLCVTASQDGLLKVWTLPALQNIATMQESNEYSALIKRRSNIRSIDISPDGQHAISAGWDVIGKYDISVWDMSSYTCAGRVPAHKQFIEAVRYVDNQQALSASWDGTVRLHDLLSGKELRVFHAHSDWVLDISPVEQSRFLTTSKDGFVCLWSLHGV